MFIDLHDTAMEENPFIQHPQKGIELCLLSATPAEQSARSVFANGRKWDRSDTILRFPHESDHAMGC